MSFGTPVVPPESWKMHGSVGSIRIFRELGGRERGRALDQLAQALPRPTQSFEARDSPARTRRTIGSNSKSLCRSG